MYAGEHISKSSVEKTLYSGPGLFRPVMSLRSAWQGQPHLTGAMFIPQKRDWYQRIQEATLRKILYLLSRTGERYSQQ